MDEMKKLKLKALIAGIKDKKTARNWFAIGALVILTLGGTLFFWPDQDINEEIVFTEETSVGKIPDAQNTQTIPALAIEEELTETQIPDEAEEIIEDLTMNWPGQGDVITAYGFGYSETFDDYRFHSGVDIALSSGDEVQAALPGTVTRISENPWWGYEVVIKHGEDLETVYKGIKPIQEAAGYQVAKGDVIGQVLPRIAYEGMMKPHLHFEIHESGITVNPMEKLN
ncbi:M23 family metallopeptidase [Dehalobacterium formicoaceticum]|uniref:M23 family metallopeptidase n=1 Tax=Dehalobacterium formicoaceticum TaxID=51515 RepID=UPI0031F68314